MGSHFYPKKRIDLHNDVTIPSPIGFTMELNNVNHILEEVSTNQPSSSTSSSVNGDRLPHNPISRLQELCVRRGLGLPVYSDTGVVGPPHERFFTVKCEAGLLARERTAHTKKMAKSAAAADVLAALNEQMSTDNVRDGTDTKLLTENITKLVLTETEENAAVDPEITQKLYSFCGKNSFSYPEYEEVAAEGASHSPIFTINLHIRSLSLTTKGVGKSKQMAKRIAAFRMLEQIKTNLPDIAAISKTNITIPQSNGSCHREFKLPASVCDMFRTLGNVPREDFEQVIQLRSQADPVNCFDRLMKICNRLGIYLNSYDVDTISEKGMIIRETFISLAFKDIPIVTTYGRNADKQKAQDSAAFSAIVSLYTTRSELDC